MAIRFSTPKIFVRVPAKMDEMDRRIPGIPEMEKARAITKRIDKNLTDCAEYMRYSSGARIKASTTPAQTPRDTADQTRGMYTYSGRDAAKDDLVRSKFFPYAVRRREEVAADPDATTISSSRTCRSGAIRNAARDRDMAGKYEMIREDMRPNTAPRRMTRKGMLPSRP